MPIFSVSRNHTFSRSASSTVVQKPTGRLSSLVPGGLVRQKVSHHVGSFQEPLNKGERRLGIRQQLDKNGIYVFV